MDLEHQLQEVYAAGSDRLVSQLGSVTMVCFVDEASVCDRDGCVEEIALVRGPDLNAMRRTIGGGGGGGGGGGFGGAGNDAMGVGLSEEAGTMALEGSGGKAGDGKDGGDGTEGSESKHGAVVYKEDGATRGGIGAGTSGSGERGGRGGLGMDEEDDDEEEEDERKRLSNTTSSSSAIVVDVVSNSDGVGGLVASSSSSSSKKTTVLQAGPHIQKSAALKRDPTQRRLLILDLCRDLTMPHGVRFESRREKIALRDALKPMGLASLICANHHRTHRTRRDDLTTRSTATTTTTATTTVTSEW